MFRIQEIFFPEDIERVIWSRRILRDDRSEGHFVSDSRFHAVLMKKTTTNKQVNSYYTSDFDSEFRCLLLITTILFFFASKIQITREKKIKRNEKHYREDANIFRSFLLSTIWTNIFGVPLGPRHFKYHVV